jgi:hypothetical protein
MLMEKHLKLRIPLISANCRNHLLKSNRWNRAP